MKRAGKGAGAARKVVVTDYTFPDLATEQATAEAAGAVLEAHHCADVASVAKAVDGASAVLVQFAPLTAEAIGRMADEAVIVRYGVGYENIDLEAALARGFRVCYVPDYCVDEVADHTAALLLSLLRRLPRLDTSIREGRWDAVATARPLAPFSETTVGFLGLGRIGRGVLDRLKPFGFDFVIADPRISQRQAGTFGAKAATARAMMAGSDAVLLHAPSTPETRHIISAESLARMKKGAVLVNCARGDLVDEAALAQALESGQLGAAALDVFEIEPLPADSPLRRAPNLLMTPHAAWYSDRAIGRLQTLAADEVARFLRGDPPRCPVPV